MTPSPAASQGPLRFRPTFWATVFTVLAVAFMAGLGTWQVQRLVWKRDLLQRIETQMAEPPVALPAEIADPQAWDYRRVSVTGTLQHDKELHLGARSMRGNVGFQILTPLVRSDGGRVVLVNRGWTPPEKRFADSRPEANPAGEVTIEGVAREPRGRAWMQPDNQPDKNFWFWIDLPAMAAQSGVPAVAPVVVEAGPAEVPGGYPLGGQTRVTIPNDHLTYAITWYSLALALLVIYVVYHLRRDPS